MLDFCIGLPHAKDSQDHSRPLFFIGHGLGGIVIKEVRCVLANSRTAWSDIATS